MGAPVFGHPLRARDRIDREFATRLDVASLAGTALSSEAHVIRSFKRAFGETPGAPVRHRGDVPRRLGDWFSLTQRAVAPTPAAAAT